MRNNLINFRHQLGMSQTQFGELVNKDKQYIHNIEAGKRKGSATVWLTIQRIFNLTNEQTLNLMEVTTND